MLHEGAATATPAPAPLLPATATSSAPPCHRHILLSFLPPPPPPLSHPPPPCRRRILLSSLPPPPHPSLLAAAAATGSFSASQSETVAGEIYARGRRRKGGANGGGGGVVLIGDTTVVLWLVVLVVVPGLVLLVRRRAVTRKEEVRRLGRLAAEESELAEREFVLAYYSELFRAWCTQRRCPRCRCWGRPWQWLVAPAQEDEAQPPAGAKGVCAVCFRPTTFRCKQCKAVKYCSFKCQIAHWRQGPKDECCPPSANTRPDDDGRVELERAAEENVSVGKLVAGTNKPLAVGSETSDANHSLKSKW